MTQPRGQLGRPVFGQRLRHVGAYWDVPVLAGTGHCLDRLQTGIDRGERGPTSLEPRNTCVASTNVFGTSHQAWPSRHPGVVLDDVPSAQSRRMPGLPMVRIGRAIPLLAADGTVSEGQQ